MQSKTEMMDVDKIQELEDKDWRGLLAAGTLVLVALGMFLESCGITVLDKVIPLATFSLGFYFGNQTTKG